MPGPMRPAMKSYSRMSIATFSAIFFTIFARRSSRSSPSVSFQASVAYLCRSVSMV